MSKRITSLFAILFFAGALAFGSLVQVNPAYAQQKVTVKPTNCKKAQDKLREKVKSKCSKKKNKEKCIKKNKSRVKDFYGKCRNCNEKLKRKAKLVKQRCAKIKDKNKKSSCLKDGKQRLETKHRECLKQATEKK